MTKEDIQEFESELEKTLKDDGIFEEAYLQGYEHEYFLNRHISNSPQILLAGSTFQEYLGAHQIPLYKSLIRNNFIADINQSGFRSYDGSWSLVSIRGMDGLYSYSIEKLRRAVELDCDDIFDSAITKTISTEELLRNAERYVENPLADPCTFVSPKLWTPDSQSKEKAILQSSAIPVLKAIQNENVELGSLHWKQLEDIVAEILRASGMQIHSVCESPQGGRDIIARTEIIPGEILTIAVEVKHREYVDRPILHTALHQNAHFPALMLVTSGRFSAGVIQEASKPENRLRLFLKDGVAVRDMINNYKF